MLRGAQMWLAHIEPDKPDHDRRTFECPECENVLIETINAELSAHKIASICFAPSPANKPRSGT